MYEETGTTLSSGGSRGAGGAQGGTCPPGPAPFRSANWPRLSRMYAYGSHAKTGVRVYYCEPIYEPMASPAVTSFFSPAPKRRAPEEDSVSADKNMQLPHDSMGQQTRPPRPETEVCTLESISESLSFLGGMPPDFMRSARFLLLATSNSVPPCSPRCGAACILSSSWIHRPESWAVQERGGGGIFTGHGDFFPTSELYYNTTTYSAPPSHCSYRGTILLVNIPPPPSSE